MAKDAFRSFYKFDKKIEIPEVKSSSEFSNDRVRITSIRETSSYHHYNIEVSESEIPLFVKASSDLGFSYKREIKDFYCLPSDGYTNEDFDKSIAEILRNELPSFELPSGQNIFSGRVRLIDIYQPHLFIHNYRTYQAFKSLGKPLYCLSGSHNSVNPEFDDKWARILDGFFTPKGRKLSQPLRKIELNEFIQNGKEGQTLKDYIISNKEYLTKVCNELNYINYSKYSEDLITRVNYISFLNFDKSMRGDIREYLLSITSSEYKKILDFIAKERNGFYRSKSFSTLDNVQSFCEEALNGLKVKPLTPKEFEEYAFRNIFKDNSYFSEDPYENIFSRVEVISSKLKYHYDSVNAQNKTDLTLYAIAKEKNLFEKSTSLECMGFIFGLIWPALWSKKNISLKINEYLLKEITEGRLKIETVFKIISTVTPMDGGKLIEISKDTNLADFDLEDTPVEWLIDIVSSGDVDKRIAGKSIYNPAIDIFGFTV